MMACLNEYCVHHINTFLQPHDWIHVSRVCKLWNLATSRNWKTITVMTHWDFGNIPKNDDALLKYWMPNKPIKVSTVDFGKMLLAAAPFVKVLDLTLDNRDEVSKVAPTNYEMYVIGELLYQVPDFKFKNVLKLVTKKSTELTTVCITGHLPEIDVIKTLFENNNITKLSLEDNTGSGWYHNVRTSTIVELTIRFKYTNADLKSFQGLFPNLKKLNLTIRSQDVEGLKILSQILPYLPALKTLILDILIHPPDEDDNSDTLFSEILKLSELEELSFNLANHILESSELFLKQLSKYCLKLRDLRFCDLIAVNEESLKALLSLPRLQNLKCSLFDGFRYIELPALKHLSKLKITCFDGYLTELTRLKGFFEVVKNAPCLEKIAICFCTLASQDTLIDFVCGIVEAATFLSKDVFVSAQYSKKEPKKFRVVKVNLLEEDENSSQSSTPLQFLFNDYENDKELIEGVKNFVRNKLYQYRVFVSDDEK